MGAQDDERSVLVQAAQEARWEDVSRLLLDEEHDVDEADVSGDTALLAAIRQGASDAVSCHYEMRSCIIIFHLSHTNNIHVVVCIDGGTICCRISVGTCIHWRSIHSVYLEPMPSKQWIPSIILILQVRMLVEKLHADVDEEGGGSLPPLLFAAHERKWSIVRYLASRGADATVQDPSGAGVALLAARAGEWDVVKFLIENTDIDVDDADRKASPRTALRPAHHPTMHLLATSVCALVSMPWFTRSLGVRLQTRCR